MADLQIFENEQFGQVRILDINSEPWFVGKDVAMILGYRNTKDALITHIDNEDRQIIKRSENTTIDNHIPKSALPVNFVNADIPNRGLTVINESGLYSLILSSKLPKAKEFKHWVTSEILPSIRRHGAYMTADTIDKVLQDPDFGIRLLSELKSEREKRQHLEAEAEKNQPKVLFADSVSASHTSILIGELAKLIKQNGVDIGQKRLFEWLRNNGYLIKRKGTDRNMPTQKSMEMGLFEVKETAISHSDGHTSVSKTTKVTGKGQVYFINKFLAN